MPGFDESIYKLPPLERADLIAKLLDIDIMVDEALEELNETTRNDSRPDAGTTDGNS